ncbi:MAG: ExbD/TolR family protein [Polyangiales bacterium]
MGMSGGGGGGRAPLGEINVTPLVDVMLVLLIIFMVAAPMMSTGVVDSQTRAPRMEMDEEKLILSIDAQQRVFLGEEEVPADRLEEALLNNARLQEDDEIYVRADQTVPYGFVLRVFATVRQAGIEKLGLVTDPAGGAADVPADGSE